MATWYTAPAPAGFSDDEDDVRNANAAGEDGDGDEDLNAGSMLRFASVADVSSFFRSEELQSVLNDLVQYTDETAKKNAITKDDPEYEFVQQCSKHVLSIEVEKTKVHKFIRDHYGVRFPELAVLCADAYTYARCVREIGNGVETIATHVEKLRELLPSQLLCAACACTATTAGRSLTTAEIGVVLEACDEMIGLEEAKQLILEYIQTRTVLICPNLCAYLGTAIASQLFAIAGSIKEISHMDVPDLISFGSQKQMKSGVKIRSAGFLMNVDMVACHPPELRHKALRLVAGRAINLARIDDNRRASDNTEGLRAREEVKRKMLEWTDPLIQQVQSRLRGLANKTYERRSRRRAADKAESDKARRGINRVLAGK
jgi:U4/U6 small nuclear ribonucleoprotein PRP31